LLYCSFDWQAHLVAVIKHYRSDDDKQPKASDAAGVAIGNAMDNHHKWRHR